MGNTTEAESLMISCHIAYCAECKEELKKYETIGGYYLSTHKELSVSKDLWKNILVKVGMVPHNRRGQDYQCWLNVLEHTNSIYITHVCFYYDTGHGDGPNH